MGAFEQVAPRSRVECDPLALLRTAYDISFTDTDRNFTR
jgi:hypothetical protein